MLFKSYQGPERWVVEFVERAWLPLKEVHAQGNQPSTYVSKIVYRLLVQKFPHFNFKFQLALFRPFKRGKKYFFRGPNDIIHQTWKNEKKPILYTLKNRQFFHSFDFGEWQLLGPLRLRNLIDLIWKASTVVIVIENKNGDFLYWGEPSLFH